MPCRSGPDTCLLPAALPEPPGPGGGAGCGGPGQADGRQGLVVPPPALEPAALSTWSMQASRPTSCLVLGEGVGLAILHENPKISACPPASGLGAQGPTVTSRLFKGPHSRQHSHSEVLGVRTSVFELGEVVCLQQALNLFSVVGTPHPSIKAASSPLAGSVANDQGPSQLSASWEGYRAPGFLPQTPCTPPALQGAEITPPPLLPGTEQWLRLPAGAGCRSLLGRGPLLRRVVASRPSAGIRP